MGVYIKGLKMPKSCLLCAFGNEFGECCVNMEIEDESEMTHSCPLIPVPDHGDLVDADEVMKTASEMAEYWETDYEMPRILQNVHVIIPAERSK